MSLLSLLINFMCPWWIRMFLVSVHVVKVADAKLIFSLQSCLFCGQTRGGVPAPAARPEILRPVAGCFECKCVEGISGPHIKSECLTYSFGFSILISSLPLSLSLFLGSFSHGEHYSVWTCLNPCGHTSWKGFVSPVNWYSAQVTYAHTYNRFHFNLHLLCSCSGGKCRPVD